MKKQFPHPGKMTGNLFCLTLCLALGAWPLKALAEAAPAPALTIDLTAIVTALLGLLSAIVTAYLAPWLKAKLGAEKYHNTMTTIRVIAQAAEQIFKGPGRGDEKLAYVKDELEKRGITYDQSLIEAAVYELGQVLTGTQTPPEACWEGEDERT